MHGSFKQVHIKVRRKMPTILQIAQKVDKFQWTSKAHEALDALKKFLTTPPVLKPPRRAMPNQLTEDLLLYISCTTHVVSTALVVERAEEGHTYPVQHHVYFISEVLGPSKKKYPQVQKLLYAVFLTTRKLRHYFDDHKVIVVTEFLIGDILHNKEAIGRIAKWACELGAQDIEFQPRTAIKTQALVDFVSEWTEHQVPDNPEIVEVWQMYFDGSLKLQGVGAVILFIAPRGEQLKYAVQLLLSASNNAAEYEALIHGLNIAISLGIKRLMVYGDSLVVISQINKECDCSNESMGKYCTAVRKLEDKFEWLEFHHVERDCNAAADALSKLGSSRTQVPPGVFVQEVSRPSISPDQAEECNVLSQPESDSNDWREPIIRYIMNEEEPDDKATTERIGRQSAHYTLIGNELYRRGATGDLMKCIPSIIGKQLLDEIHAGQCGIHATSRTLVGKVFSSSFYWPTTKSDAAELVQRCEACQFLSKQHHLSTQQLQTIPVTWPFACWGLDMIGPFKKAQGGYTHVLVAIDKFIKWIEYKPIASLTSAKAVEFIQDIIFRFGIPNSIITDLGSNFTSSEFFDFYEQRSIRIKYASVAHPRANGQVERVNGMILEALRKKVFDKNETFAGKWITELPYVVWSLRTQPSRALHGNTPFFMIYGSEAVLPADLRFGAPRLVFENIAEAEATRLEDIDVLEEERLNTVIQSARYQQTLRHYHDKAVRHRSFVVGDLVLRRILTGEGRHKLSLLWEGPFVVAEVTRPGSYRLTQMDGMKIGNSWNIEHLRKFYP
jgi:ribonuclease HI/transposase InsO family protein